ncbi:MAG: HigA family addiction module antitoxin [Caldilineaceae bacterium]
MQMDNNLVPAYTPTPGELLKLELDARGWTQGEFAEIISKPQQAVSQIINGKKQITPETALRISRALGTSPELWNNLEAEHQLALARQNTVDSEMSEIEIRSRLHELAPVPELTRRGWIPTTETVQELQQAICNFLHIETIHETPSLQAKLRQSELLTPEQSAQIAWLRRVEWLVQQAAPLDRQPLESDRLIADLLTLTAQAEDVAQVSTILQRHGIHFVIVPALARAYVDGATFVTGGERVIALSLRSKRIDSFWFTLLHEVAHIVLGHDDFQLDIELEENGEEAHEREANQQAREWLIPSTHYKQLLQFGKEKIYRDKAEAFAAKIGRHPGIVAGRLKHEAIWEWRWHRALQVDVDGYLQEWIDQPNER